MSIILSLLINLLSALLGFIVGKLWFLLKKKTDLSIVRQFWTFSNSQVAIVFPMYGDSRYGEEAPKTMAQIEDILAIAKITKLLNDSKINYRLVDDNTELRADEDLILICSPKGNKQSAKFANGIDITYNYGENGPYFRDTKTSREYNAPIDRRESNADTGLIAKVKLDNPSRTVFYIWGLHGPGTLGAADFSTSTKNMRSVNSKLIKDGVIFLLDVPFHRIGRDDNSGVREPGECSLLTLPRQCSAIPR